MPHRGKLLKRIFAVPKKSFIPIKQKLFCCFFRIYFALAAIDAGSAHTGRQEKRGYFIWIE